MRVPGSALAGALLCTALLVVLPAAPAFADPACPGSDTQPTASNLPEVEAATLCLVNVQRAQNGLGALAANAVLRSAALQHSQDMVKNNFFSHDSSSGEDFEDRILRFKYAPRNARFVVGENIAWGTLSLATPDAIVSGWMNSPPHRANILGKKYKELGVGIVASTPDGDPTGATYTADFGVKASAPPRVAKKHKKHKAGRRHHRAKKKHHKAKKHGGCKPTSNSAVSLCSG